MPSMSSMKRPSWYPKHNSSLDKFCKLFNDEGKFKNLVIEPITEETYDNDGVIRDIETGMTIGFDWEQRANPKHFSNCQFAYDSLGQFERKIRKRSIQISIQCDYTETGIAVGWHEDWLKENSLTRYLATDSEDEHGIVRYTKSFRIYSYDQMTEFKAMLNRAMKHNVLNHKAFSCN